MSWIVVVAVFGQTADVRHACGGPTDLSINTRDGDYIGPIQGRALSPP